MIICLACWFHKTKRTHKHLHSIFDEYAKYSCPPFPLENWCNKIILAKCNLYSVYPQDIIYSNILWRIWFMYSLYNKIISINPTPAMVTWAYWYNVWGKSHLIRIHRLQNAANKNKTAKSIHSRVRLDCLVIKYQYIIFFKYMNQIWFIIIRIYSRQWGSVVTVLQHAVKIGRGINWRCWKKLHVLGPCSRRSCQIHRTFTRSTEKQPTPFFYCFHYHAVSFTNSKHSEQAIHLVYVYHTRHYILLLSHCWWCVRDVSVKCA